MAMSSSARRALLHRPFRTMRPVRSTRSPLPLQQPNSGMVATATAISSCKLANDILCSGLPCSSRAPPRALTRSTSTSRSLTRVASLRRAPASVMQQLACAWLFAVAVAFEFRGRMLDGMASFAVTSRAVCSWPMRCCIHPAIDPQRELCSWSVCRYHVPSAFALVCSMQRRPCWACVGAESGQRPAAAAAALAACCS